MFFCLSLFICLFVFFLQCTCRRICKSVEYNVMWCRNPHRYIHLWGFFRLQDWPGDTRQSRCKNSKTRIQHISIIKLIRICALGAWQQKNVGKLYPSKKCLTNYNYNYNYNFQICCNCDNIQHGDIRWRNMETELFLQCITVSPATNQVEFNV